MIHRPNINPKFYIIYLLSVTGSESFFDLSIKIPRSASHIGDVYNCRAPLSNKFVNETLKYINKSLEDYLEWIVCNDQIDRGMVNTKKQRRNDFDQINFLKFVEKLVFMKTKLSKKDMIEIIGISDSLYNQILNEQRILSDDTLYKINKQFGINENSYFAYTIDPNIMINHISSLQLENFNKKASL